MSSLRSFSSSSIGSKILIGVSGLALVGFLILHLAGNLLVFVSPETFNEYGEKMIRNPLLVPAELGLLAIFLLHVFKTVRLYIGSHEARPTGYVKKQGAGHTSRKSWASSTMILTGTFLFVFVIVHLKTFKFGAYYASETQAGVRDLYRLMVEVYANPLWVLFYLVSMGVVGFHLWHGVSSAFQSLGVDAPGVTSKVRAAGRALAILVAAGFVVIPLWLYFAGGR